MASKLRRGSSQDGVQNNFYMLTSFCTVLASILEGLGIDFVPLGVHLGSNLAPKNASEPPKSAQKPSKTSQELSKSRPRRPGAAQDLPRTRPGAAQDNPRACQEPTKMPRSRPFFPFHEFKGWGGSLRTLSKRPSASTKRSYCLRFCEEGGMRVSTKSGLESFRS